MSVICQKIKWYGPLMAPSGFGDNVQSVDTNKNRGREGNKALSRSFTASCHVLASGQRGGRRRRRRQRESSGSKSKPASRSVATTNKRQEDDEAFKCGGDDRNVCRDVTGGETSCVPEPHSFSCGVKRRRVCGTVNYK